MNWIIYAILSVIKLFIISVLVLISVVLMPVILLLFSLGIVLSYLRDVEPKIYARDYSSLSFDPLSFINMKATWLTLHPRVQRVHLLMRKDKSVF